MDEFSNKFENQFISAYSEYFLFYESVTSS